jgi:hypothetical protein
MPPTKFRARSSFGRAFPSHGKGGEFNSRRVHQVCALGSRLTEVRCPQEHMDYDIHGVVQGKGSKPRALSRRLRASATVCT